MWIFNMLRRFLRIRDPRFEKGIAYGLYCNSNSEKKN